MNAYLFAPLDALRFTVVYAALAFAPGFALASLLRPRAHVSEHCAFAIPCAYSMVAISGLITALLHLPYGLAAYGALAVPVTLAGAYALWRSRDAERPNSGVGYWWLVPTGVAIVQIGAIAVAFAGDVVPTGFDVLAHVMWTDAIARAHVFPFAPPSAHAAPGAGGFYPLVFHVLAALVLSVAPMPTYRAVFFVVIASIALLPLALFGHARTATGSARLAGLATIAALAFEPMPFFSLAQSLYTFVVSFLFVPAIALALRDGLGRADRRAVALAAILGVGLFYTHPTEFVTVALLALAIVPGLLRNLRSWVRAAGYGAIVATAWGIAAAPALAAVHRTMATGAQAEIHAAGYFQRPAQVHLGTVLNVYMQWIYGRNVSFLLLIATLIGIAWCVTRRRLLNLVVVQLMVTALFVDSVSYNILQRFYVLSYPWVIWERLSPTHYWFTLPLAAIGIDVIARAMSRLLRAKDRTFVAIVAAPLVLIGVLLPLGVAAGRAEAYSHARRVVAPADLGSLAWLARHAPANAVVVNDADMAHLADFDAPIDAGRWMPVLGGPQPLFWRSGSGNGPLNDRLYLLDHIADTPLPLRAADFVRQYNVRYVLYGAAVRPGATRHLSLPRLFDDPHLRLVYSSAAECSIDRKTRLATCPTTASYVFAIT